mgnify:CR=1 FL=1
MRLIPIDKENRDFIKNLKTQKTYLFICPEYTQIMNPLI